MISKAKAVVADYKLLLRNVPTMMTMFFIVTTILMNLSASKIIFNTMNVAVTGGFLLSWAPFLAMDTVTKRFGARASIMLNILSAVFNLFAVIFLWIVAAIPTETPYPEFNYIYSGVWFIVLSSTVAFVISGIINSLINAAIGKLFKNKTSLLEFIMRSYVSTFIGQALDNFIFIAGVYVVFAPIFWGLEPMPILTCIGTAVIGGLFELIAEAILSPFGYRIVKKWERDNIGHEYIEAHTSKSSSDSE